MGCFGNKNKNRRGGDDKSLKKRISKIIDEEEERRKGNELNFIGLQHILPKSIRMWLRLAWTIVIVTCVVLCIYQIIDRVEYYYTYPKSVSIELDERSYVEFPIIGITNTRNFDWNDHVVKCVKNVNISECDVQLVDFVDQRCQRSGHKKYTQPEKMWRKATLMGSSTSFLPEDKRFGIPLVEVDKKKFFNDRPMTHYGLTAILEPLNVTQEYFGTMSSIGFTMFGLEDDEDCGGLRQMIFIERGRHIDPSISRNFGAKPFLGVAFKRQELHRVSTPNDPCIPRAIYVKCIDLCYRAKMYMLNCSLPYMPPGNSSRPICTDFTEARTVNAKAYEISQFKNLDDTCGCVKPCFESNLSYQIEVIDMNPPGLDFGVLLFYFPTSIVEVSKEDYAYGTTQLFSDIGGNLGLFLGFCLLSLIDSLQLLIDIVYEQLQVRNKKKRTAHHPDAFTTPIAPMANGKNHRISQPVNPQMEPDSVAKSM